MKLLCAADLHLGRQASRLPPHLDDLAPDLTPARAWRQLVELAVQEGVTAVLLAGDVVEDEFDYFEAYGDLRRGAQDLAAAGIALVAVAGNHDVGVLPRLASSVSGVELLGEGGAWGHLALEAGGSAVNVVGWSWPAAQVKESPLVGLEALLSSIRPAPTIGLLHCDLDQSSSVYAPVRRSELAAAQVDAWLLGHVHKPTFAVHAPGRWLGYLGSTFGADPGEEGSRGAWQVSVGDEGLECRHVALSPLLFDSVEVDVTGLGVPSEVSGLVTDALAEHAAGLADRGLGRPLAVGVRLRFVGSSDQRAAVEAHLGKEDPTGIEGSWGGSRYFVHSVSYEVYPSLDVAAVARSEGPRALLARRLLLLDGPPSEERSGLIERARTAALAAAGHASYRGLEPPELSDDVVADTLRRAATRLLAEMSS